MAIPRRSARNGIRRRRNQPGPSEAGVRSKIAVWSKRPGVDPVGTFCGRHGTRVNAKLASEIGGARENRHHVFSDNPLEYIMNALPNKVTSVKIDENRQARPCGGARRPAVHCHWVRAAKTCAWHLKLTGYELILSPMAAPVRPLQIIPLSCCR